MIVDKVALDSDLFRLNIGSYKFRDTNEWNQEEVDKWDLLYISTDPGNDRTNEFLLSRNIFLADKKTTYRLDLSEEKGRKTNTSRVHVYESSAIDQHVIDIGIQSSLYSRFMVDLRFPNEKAREMYRIWMRRSIDREIADEVFICKDHGDEVMGVITVSKNHQRVDIGILAVDQRYRGQQIGKELVQAVIDYSRNNGYSQVQVVTQGANIAACQFYESCGFKVNDVVNLYHYWRTIE
jgi:dTDP-4-amino-4,6-dideoxy-D-galactose acyltransferase